MSSCISLGYQYPKTEQEFMMAMRQIQRIRSVHPRMRTHVECVSGAGPDVIAMMLRYVFPAADSIGLNERELGMFTRVVREEDPGSLSLVPASPVPRCEMLSHLQKQREYPGFISIRSGIISLF